MLPGFLSFLVLSPLSALAQQTVYNQAHNTTAIGGTWSSGVMNVLTGTNFANPGNRTFNYPKTTGMSYSFTETGFYEIARYRLIGNGSAPNCITGVMNWVHGTFTYNANGSLTMTPFGDGFQQIQNACAANSDFIESYNDTELYQSWQITTDAVLGPILQLYQFDQSPISPMTLYSASPVMLPTQSLRSVSPAAKAANRLELASGAPPSHRWQVVSITVVSALLGTVLLVLS